MFQEFFHSEVSGSIVLLVFAIAALIWSNSPWAATYFELEHTYIGVSWGDEVFKLSLGHWIGDGLMVLFFFVVGLEIKREIVVGNLSSMRQAILPVSAAVGGMLLPAGLYACFNLGGSGASGWGIPMATDITFALGVLALFGARAPIGLKVFLTALAIADDLGAVVVIAVFYTEQISWIALAVASGFLFSIFVIGRLGIRQMWIYLLLALGCWVAVLASGVHATVAGVLIAMLIPMRGKIDAAEFLATGKRRIAELEASGLTNYSMFDDHDQVEMLDDPYITVEDMRPPGLALEHLLHPIQAFLVLPLFALFKAGVPLTGDAVSDFPSSIRLGIIAGLVIGKPLGVTLFT
jgi:NhaA family Na+:H+ antiporter